jgi:4-amino-4-deoxy-L-arabinose transferase-like glycosyltransferase
MKRVKQRASCSLLLASRFLLLVILLLASFLRFYRIDGQSFWNDEGNSARIAERTFDLILEGAAGDIHPPGYYLLLHGWRALFGQSEYALRSLSAVAGLALAIFTYLLGRHLFGEATGLTAAFLGAISPFAVYYSQEARMYALLAALSAASTYALLRLLTIDRSPVPGPQSLIPNTQYQVAPHLRPGTLAAYVLTCAAGLYTHYAFPFVLLVHNATFSLWWLTATRRSAHRWRWLALWAGAQAGVVVLYLPWLPVALKSVTGWSSAGRTYELGPALRDLLGVLSVGITLPAGKATAALVGAGLLLVVGLWSARPRPDVTEESPTAGTQRMDRTGWLGVASVALYLLLPIALIFAFDLYKPAWLKFLVVVLPPFHILVAHGIENLARLVSHASRITHHLLRAVLRLSLLAILTIPPLPSLHNLYFSPTYARDDYRQIAADVAALARPSDGVVLNAPNQWEVFTYYHPKQHVYPAPYRPDPAEVEAFLRPLIEPYRRLFVLYWGDAESDPQRLIETWLAAHAYKAADRWYGRVRLATYGVAPQPEEPAVPLDARFGEHIRLRGYALVGDSFAPGDILPATLFWETQAPIPEPYKVTVQLLDNAAQLVAQHDTEPGDGLTPTTIWEPGQVLADRHGIPLPTDLAPGRYALVVGLYHIATGERLSVTLSGESHGDHLILKQVEVTPPR